MAANHRQELIIDCSPSELLLTTEDGLPVWPVSNQEQYKLLAAICEKCCASLTEVKGIPQTVKPVAGEVLYYEQHLSEAATLYGHLTNRSIKRLEDAASLADAAVVLTHYEALNHDMIERLYRESAGDSAPGIICISESEPVLNQILYHAATAHLAGPPFDKAVLFNPTFSVDTIDVDGSIVVGSKAPGDIVRGLLREDRALKMVITHSDGVDAFWGQQLSMCGVRDRLSAPVSPVPRCVETGWCHRQQMSVEAALADGRLMSPSEVRSWILFWGVCWGVFVNPRINDTRWSVTRQFMEAKVSPAVITSWTVEIINPDLYLMLVAYALDGMTVGQIVRRITSSALGRKDQLGLCLMGDPRVRLYCPRVKRKKGSVETRATRAVSLRRSPPAKDNGAKLRFLKLLVDAEPSMVGPRAQTAKRLSTALTALAKSGLDTDVGSNVKRIQSLMTTYVSISGLMMMHRWIDKAEYQPARSRNSRFCSWCWPQPRQLREFAAHICGLKRRFSFCSVCGMVEDTPWNSVLKAFVHGSRTIRLEGLPDESSWAGAIAVLPQVQSEHLAIPWQRDTRDRPVRDMIVDQALPIGPIDAGIVFMFGLDLYILARRHRGPTIG